MPGAIGEAFVEIRPDTSSFERSLQSNLPASLGRVGQNLTVPIKANTQQWETDWAAAGSRVSTGLKTTLGAVGIGLGVTAAVSVVKSGFDVLIEEAEQANRAIGVFGKDGAQQLSQWASTSVTALGLTKGEALKTANQLGDMLRGFGDKAPLQDAEALTQRLRDLAASQGKSFEDVQGTFIAALRSGRTAAVREIIPDINDADLKAQAEKMGLITTSVNDPKVAKMRADLKVLDDEIAKAQKGGTADPQTIELAQLRVTAATKAHGEAVKNLGSGSQAALTTQIALVSAEDALTKARQSSVPDQDKVNQLLADRGVLQQQIDDAEKGSLDNLDQNGKALATVKLALQDTLGVIGARENDPAKPFQDAEAAIKEAEGKLAKGLMPEVTRFSDWVTQHGDDINHFADNLGKFLGSAADAAGTLIKWFTDHPQALEAIGAAFAVKKLDDWASTAKNVINDVASVWGRVLGNKTLPSVGGGTGVPSPAMTVGEMTVGTLITKSMVGGPGGLPGSGGPTGTILGPDGRPLPPTAEPNPNPYAIDSAVPEPPKPPAGLFGSIPEMPAAFKGVGLQAVAAAGTASLKKSAYEEYSKTYADLQNPNSDQYKAILAQYESGSTSGGAIQGVQRESANALINRDRKTSDDLKLLLGSIQSVANSENAFTKSTTQFFEGVKSDLDNASALIFSLQSSQRALELQTHGTQGGQLNAGVGSVSLGRQTFRSTAIGGWFDVPTPVMVGDAPSGGEAVLNSPQLHAVVAGAVASALSQFAPRSTAQGMVFSPTINGVGMDELKAVMEREFYRFMRLWNDNQQRGLPPMHGFSSS